MSGSGYDLSTSIYSQDGRIFQIEYAQKAIENSETVLGIQCADGVILASEKILLSPLQTRNSNPRVLRVSNAIGMAISGRLTDGMIIYERAQKEVESYKNNFGIEIPTKVLVERLANYMHIHTLYGQFRPLGADVLIASRENGKNQLYKIESSGSFRGYFGVTSGKGHQVAKTWLEKTDRNKTIQQCLKEVALGLVSAHEEFKEKTWEMEVGWVGETTDNQWQMVSEELRNQKRNEAEEQLEI